MTGMISPRCYSFLLTLMAPFISTEHPRRTFSCQDKLPRLPIPPLEDTCRRYLKALEALQDEKEHELTTAAVKEFLEKDGPEIQKRLRDWAKDKDGYASLIWNNRLKLIDAVILRSSGISNSSLLDDCLCCIIGMSHTYRIAIQSFWP
jgi:hypothetical protein